MPDITIPTDKQVAVTKASGFAVVSWWQDKSNNYKKGEFQYDHRPTLNDALDLYREYQDGEWGRATAMGVFACDACGLPIHRLDPEYLMRLMAETRAA